MRDLDPRWQWAEVRRLCDYGPRYIKGPCNHLEVVPVESGGEVVAHLCLTCDQQLPAEWQPDPFFAAPTVAEIDP